VFVKEQWSSAASILVSLWKAGGVAERTQLMRKGPVLSNWLFQQEVPIPQYATTLMVLDEQSIAAYVTPHDYAILLPNA